MKDNKKKISKYMFFSEPKETEQFILKESKYEGLDKKKPTDGKTIKNIKETGSCKRRNYIDDAEKDEEKSDGEKYNLKQKIEISKKLENSLDYIKKVYSVPTNGDLVIREFDIVVKDKVIPAFMVFFDGMTDRKVINDDILQPLMLLSNLDIKSDENNIAEYIRSHILPHNQLKEVREYQEVIDEVNFGGCGIFIDGIDSAFAADVKGWEHRGVDRPNTELVIRGPQEGFIETLRSNTGLIRKILKDENLIVEDVIVGKKSKTPCSMMYISDIANDSLVSEVRRRLEGIKVDYVIDSGEIEQLIEDSTFLPAPQILATERPDRVAGLLTQGRVAIVVHGSPFVLVVPTTSFDLIHTSEDAFIRFPFANLLRLIRILGIIMSLLLPGIYIAITNFHHEMIPTDLLFAIESSRERVPFPSVVEILIMEIAFELIREAGIRIPGPIGPTLGIIGALILGQAAVAANIVSPILIIIVAVTGIGSFSIPSFAFAFTFRILRFVYIILGAISGFLGIALGLFIQGLWLVNTKSFGVPFLSPYAPRTKGGFFEDILVAPMWKQEKRSDFINAKEVSKQPNISREWTKQKKNGGEDSGK